MGTGQAPDFDQLVEDRYRALHAKARARADNDDDIDNVIHDQRVALKRLRALWQLARPTVASKLPRIANRRLRDTGRTLGPARDARVADNTLDMIMDGVDDSETKEALACFKRRISPKHPAAKRDAVDESLQQMLSTLDEDAISWQI